MASYVSSNNPTERVPASITPNQLNTLAELVAAKLAAKSRGCLPFNQVVAGTRPARLI